MFFSPKQHNSGHLDDQKHFKQLSETASQGFRPIRSIVDNLTDDREPTEEFSFEDTIEHPHALEPNNSISFSFYFAGFLLYLSGLIFFFATKNHKAHDDIKGLGLH